MVLPNECLSWWYTKNTLLSYEGMGYGKYRLWWIDEECFFVRSFSEEACLDFLSTMMNWMRTVLMCYWFTSFKMIVPTISPLPKKKNFTVHQHLCLPTNFSSEWQIFTIWTLPENFYAVNELAISTRGNIGLEDELVLFFVKVFGNSLGIFRKLRCDCKKQSRILLTELVKLSALFPLTKAARLIQYLAPQKVSSGHSIS